MLLERHFSQRKSGNRRRKFDELIKDNQSLVALQAVQRIAWIYRIEREVQSLTVTERRSKQSCHNCEGKVVTLPLARTAGGLKPSNDEGFQALRSKGVTSQSMPWQRSKVVTAI